MVCWVYVSNLSNVNVQVRSPVFEGGIEVAHKNRVGMGFGLPSVPVRDPATGLVDEYLSFFAKLFCQLNEYSGLRQNQKGSSQ